MVRDDEVEAVLSGGELVVVLCGGGVFVSGGVRLAVPCGGVEVVSTGGGGRYTPRAITRVARVAIAAHFNPGCDIAKMCRPRKWASGNEGLE